MADEVFNVMRRLVWRASSIAAIVLAACGGSLNGPTLVEHKRDSFVEVPYPPPAALAETVVPRPAQGGLVWLDGDWSFRGKSYAWRRGGWFVPPAGARYAVSRIDYLTDGRLMFAPGAWYGVRGEMLPRVRPVQPAATPSNAVTSEFLTGR